MGSLRRYVSSGGATFAWPLSAEPLQEARDRHVVAGVPGVVNSPYGRALSFDGANDYITLGAAWEDQLRFDQGTADFSIVAWVRRGVTGAWHWICGKRDASNDGYAFAFGIDDTLIGTVDNIAIYGPSTVTDALWHCVAFVVDRSGDALVYIDGTPGTGVAIGGEVMATTIAPTIGCRAYDNLWRFQGDIAGVVIFDRVLSAAECLGMTGAGGGPF